MRLKSLSLILNPTTVNTWHTQPTKHPFSITPIFQLTSPHVSQRLRFTPTFFDSTLHSSSFLHTCPPANGSLSWIKGWFTDGFSVMKNLLPVAFLALANVAHYSLLLLLRTEKNSPPVSTQNPEYMQTQGVKKGKNNYWITIDYMTVYTIKEYMLRNKCYE